MVYSANKDKQKRYRRVLLVAFALLLISALSLFVLEKTHITDFFKTKKQADTNQPTASELKQQKVVNNNDKQKFIEGAASPTPSDTNTQPISSKVEVTAAMGQNNTVTVYSKIYDATATKCTLEVSNGDKKFTKEVTVIFQPDYSICAGFSVPVSELGNGNWEIKLSVITSSNTLVANTQLKVN